MSINASLTAAMSGLTAATRAAEVVSSNIANAMTEGYGRQELALSPSGDGVRIDQISRMVDQVLLADRRNAMAARGNAVAQADAFLRIESALGVPGEPQALSTLLSDFEASLIEAASRPDSTIRLDNVLRSAGDLAGGLSDASREVQEVRSDAERELTSEVGRLNTALETVADLNTRIQKMIVVGQSPNALMDERQRLLDSIAEMVPVREVLRDHGQVSLYTEGGAVLLEGGRAAAVGFDGNPAVTVDMTRENGALSGLTLNGRPISTGEGGQMSGGKLAALFAVRDEIGPQAQAQLDALARDLIARTESADADAPFPAGAGLFTDAGAALDPGAEQGLARRIAVHAAVDPARGGELWRLRDGIGAPAPGDTGDTRALRALEAALAAPTPPSSGTFSDVPRSFSGLAADVLSQLGGQRQAAESRAASASARAWTLQEMQLRDGVDTDAELQKLLLIERAYAANARVLQAADDMIQTLLRIGS